MDFFRRRAGRASTSAAEPAPSRAPQTPGRTRHSTASTLGVPRPGGGRRSIFAHMEPGRPPAYREPPPRSISASYAPSARSRVSNVGIPRSSTTYGRGRSLAQLAASPEKPKTRMDRIKTKVAKRFDMSSYFDWPGDKWMEFREYIEIELMCLDEMGYSFGIGIVGFHLMIRIVMALEMARRNVLSSKRSPFSSSSTTGTLGVEDRLSEARALAKSNYSFDWLNLLSLLSVSLFLFSCYNTYKVFSARRPYRMQIRDDPINSPNATLVQSPTAPQSAPQTWGQMTWKMIRRLSSLLIGWPRPGADDVAKPTQIHQLDVWDPSPTRLKIFTLYPPVTALIFHSANLNENAMSWTLTILAIASHSHLFIKNYSQLVKDKSVVQAEVMHEYNAQFVYPRVFPPTREQGTMTSSAEFIRREDWFDY